jgi:hypothetical protein
VLHLHVEHGGQPAEPLRADPERIDPLVEVLPERPLRQWVLSLPYALRFLLATDPDALTLVLGAVHRTISG